jgi:hypothetical protein
MHPNKLVCPSTFTLLVEINVTLSDVFDGVIQPPQHAHVSKGGWLKSLGMRPSCPVLSQMQPTSPSTIIRKVRCVPPLVLHVTIVHPRCSFSHPLVYIRLTSHMPLVFSFPTRPQVFPRSVRTWWVSRKTLHPPPLQVVFIPNNIHRYPWCLYPISGSHHHSTTTMSSIVVVKENSP